MSAEFDSLPFRPANILMPRGCDLSLWSVVACDQYSSQPEYWQRVEERVGRAPSALRLILPESCLDGPDLEHDIMEINSTMARYLRDGRFASWPDSMFYVERTLRSGRVRRGLVGMVDLTQYDYEEGALSPVRCTEGTVSDRIPPRVSVRKNAPVELPHAILVTDDPERSLIEPLGERKKEMRQIYDFDLMENGGHLAGWVLTPELKSRTAEVLTRLADRAAQQSEHPLVLAVGDGNHSLATAKECYERQKRFVPEEQWGKMPARFALCELCNLHDPALEFEPVHRVLFRASPGDVADAFERFYPDAAGETITLVSRDREYALAVPEGQLPVTAVQNFLDRYLEDRPGLRLDYIQGTAAVCALAGKRPDTAAFLLPPMQKEVLFEGIVKHGPLPAKAFSVGEPEDKRFYLEARRIRT